MGGKPRPIVESHQLLRFGAVSQHSIPILKLLDGDPSSAAHNYQDIAFISQWIYRSIDGCQRGPAGGFHQNAMIKREPKTCIHCLSVGDNMGNNWVPIAPVIRGFGDLFGS